jgi:hypothetical protein
MDDENIIPYEPSPTLTVNQAVMHMLGFRDEYTMQSERSDNTWRWSISFSLLMARPSRPAPQSAHLTAV